MGPRIRKEKKYIKQRKQDVGKMVLGEPDEERQNRTESQDNTEEIEETTN